MCFTLGPTIPARSLTIATRVLPFRDFAVPVEDIHGCKTIIYQEQDETRLNSVELGGSCLNCVDQYIWICGRAVLYTVECCNVKSYK